MTLMTGEQYRASLKDQRRVWIEGERVADVTRHPAFAGMIDAVARIYDLQHETQYRDALTYEAADGQRRSRFYKLPETQDDLVQRRHMTLAVLNEVSPVIDRFGDETVTPLFVLADRRETLDRFDARYSVNVQRWLDRLQRTNLFMTSGNTDLKGDRSKQPYQQPDLDHYLRVVKERDDGIVVRGAKYETGASYAHVAFVKPTVGSWLPENRDYAVACIVPLNAPGLRHICRPPLVRGADPFDRPLSSRFDEVDTLMIFDDVFVPWEDVIFSRQPELANLLRSDLTRWAAQGFLLRSFVKADVIVGTALLVAEQTRTIAIPQVRERIAQLMVFRETLHSFVLAAEAAPERTETGLWMPNQAIQNAGRVYASTTYNGMVHILRDLIGGSPVVVPDRRSMENPDIKADIEKYFRVNDVTAEARIRVLNLATELTASPYAGRAQSYQIFAESPIMAQAMALYGTFDRDGAKRRAARLAGLHG
jgi:4-hydroxyphenylacetate 3-monooxygenase